MRGGCRLGDLGKGPGSHSDEGCQRGSPEESMKEAAAASAAWVRDPGRIAMRVARRAAPKSQ